MLKKKYPSSLGKVTENYLVFSHTLMGGGVTRAPLKQLEQVIYKKNLLLVWRVNMFLSSEMNDFFLVVNNIKTWRRQWHPTPVLLPGKSHGRRSLVGCSPWGLEESDTEWLHFHALEKEMATQSSALAWRIPGMVEPGGLPSMGSHRVGHDWSD